MAADPAPTDDLVVDKGYPQGVPVIPFQQLYRIELFDRQINIEVKISPFMPGLPTGKYRVIISTQLSGLQKLPLRLRFS
jgi:hypothetical protein